MFPTSVKAHLPPLFTIGRAQTLSTSKRTHTHTHTSFSWAAEHGNDFSLSLFVPQFGLTSQVVPSLLESVCSFSTSGWNLALTYGTALLFPAFRYGFYDITAIMRYQASPEVIRSYNSDVLKQCSHVTIFLISRDVQALDLLKHRSGQLGQDIIERVRYCRIRGTGGHRPLLTPILIPNSSFLSNNRPDFASKGTLQWVCLSLAATCLQYLWIHILISAYTYKILSTGYEPRGIKWSLFIMFPLFVTVHQYATVPH